MIEEQKQSVTPQVQPGMPVKAPIKVDTLFNPTNEDLVFFYDSAMYQVPAGEQVSFPSHIVKHGAKKLADKNVMTPEPDEHKVLMAAYLQKSEPEVIAKGLGIDLEKVRKEALSKKQEQARVVNLEAQVRMLAEQVTKLTEAKEPSKPVESPKEEEVEVKAEEPKKKESKKKK
jgi:cellobiose-specific phosphotransferase system component IIB